MRMSMISISYSIQSHRKEINRNRINNLTGYRYTIGMVNNMTYSYSTAYFICDVGVVENRKTN